MLDGVDEIDDGRRLLTVEVAMPMLGLKSRIEIVNLVRRRVDERRDNAKAVVVADELDEL